MVGVVFPMILFEFGLVVLIWTFRVCYDVYLFVCSLYFFRFDLLLCGFWRLHFIMYVAFGFALVGGFYLLLACGWLVGSDYFGLVYLVSGLFFWLFWLLF